MTSAPQLIVKNDLKRIKLDLVSFFNLFTKFREKGCKKRLKKFAWTYVFFNFLLNLSLYVYSYTISRGNC